MTKFDQIWQELTRFNKIQQNLRRFNKIQQDMARFTWFDKIRQYMARFGKIGWDFTFDRFSKIQQDFTRLYISARFAKAIWETYYNNSNNKNQNKEGCTSQNECSLNKYSNCASNVLIFNQYDFDNELERSLSNLVSSPRSCKI